MPLTRSKRKNQSDSISPIANKKAKNSPKSNKLGNITNSQNISLPVKLSEKIYAKPSTLCKPTVSVITNEIQNVSIKTSKDGTTSIKRKQEVMILKCGFSESDLSKPKPKFKHQKTEKNQTINEAINDDEATLEIELKYFQAIESCLGDKYFDVCRRFRLEYRPSCVLNFVECGRKHQNRNAIAPVVADDYKIYESRLFLIEDRYKLHLKYVRSLIARKIFLGANILRDIFTTILTYDDNESTTSSQYLIGDASNTIENCLQVFPSCWRSIKPYYLALLRDPFETDNVHLNKYNPQKGLFSNVLLMLQDLMETDSQTNCDHTSDEDMVNMNFYDWAEQRFLRDENNVMNRDDRLERLFLVLSILTKIMENEFAVWSLKYYKNIKKHLCDAEIRPIVASLIWPDTKVTGELNDLVKKILTVYVKAIALDYPEHTVGVLARLVNLVSHITYLSEVQNSDNPEATNYPIFNLSLVDILAKELFKTTTAHQIYYHKSLASNSNMLFYKNVMKCLRSPFIRMLYGKLVLDKINNTNYGLNNLLNMKFIWNEIERKSWLECESDTPLIMTDGKSDDMFPVLKKKKLKKMEKIYMVDYLDVLFITLLAYLSYTRLTDVVAKLKQSTENVELKPTTPFKSNSSSEIENRRKSSLQGKVAKPKLFYDSIMVDANLAARYMDDVKYIYELEKSVMENYRHHKELKQFQILLMIDLKNRPTRKSNR